MPRKTKQKLTIDGKTSTDANSFAAPVVNNGGKYGVRSIDELLGRRENPYSSGTIEEYESKLRGMPLSDLERHATELGSLPNSNRNTLINRLLDKYRKVSSQYHNSNQSFGIEPKDPNKLREILKHAK